MRPVVIERNNPSRMPGFCIRCRVAEISKREFFVDTGVDTEWDGVLYLCNMCMEDLVHAAGMFTKRDVDGLLADQMAVVDRANETQKKYEEVIDYLEMIGISISTVLEHKKVLDGQRNYSNPGHAEPAINGDYSEQSDVDDSAIVDNQQGFEFVSNDLIESDNVRSLI